MFANLNKVLVQLNAAQHQAVDSLEGPVMVIAGPGTGKTQVLAARIANILAKTDTNPQAILALTFTESAATTMRERLFTLIGAAAYRVRIQTFHSFCDEIIRAHPEYFEFGLEAEPLSDLELIEFLRKFFNNAKLKYLRTARSSFHYLYAAKQALQNIKREGLFPDEFAKLVEQESKFDQSKLTKNQLKTAAKRLGKLEELSQLYQAYQDFLNTHNRYDYEDMILQVVRVFKKNPELLAEYQEQLLYFLVDEYQDANSAQNKVLDLLAEFWGEAANVFVVGDPNQTIYRFQGANLENVLGFMTRYPSVSVIILEVGYRCSQEIYEAAAHALSLQEIKATKFPEVFSVLKRPLQALQNLPDSLQLVETSTDTAEKVWLSEKLKELLSQKVAPENIAILVKKNREASEWAGFLANQNIPYSLERDENILEAEIIRQLLTLMQVILALQAGEEAYSLYEVLLYEWSRLKSLKVLQLARLAKNEGKSLAESLELAPSEVEGLLKDDDELKVYYQQLVDLAAADFNSPFIAWFPLLLEKTGVRDWLLSSQESQPIQLVNALYQEIKTINLHEKNLKLARFLDIITAFEEQKIEISKRVLLGSEAGVTISTTHGAKGKEWEYVFLPNQIDKHWGNARSPVNLPLPAGVLRFQAETKADKNEDDRRLFYVGLTRAKQAVFLSFAKQNEAEKKTQVASMFASELMKQGLELTNEKCTIENAELNLVQQKTLLPRVSGKDMGEFRSWLSGIVREFKLSPTALNTYLRDPQEFFFNSLLKLPRAKTAPLIFGTAIHVALEYLYRQASQLGAWPDLKLAQAVFQTALERQILPVNELAARLNQGQEILAAYYQALPSQDFTQLKSLEYNFGVASRPVVLDDIYLTGKVDRIDWLDKQKKTIRLVDYKTGHKKSVNEIEGKTATSQKDMSERELNLPESLRGPYKRQLVFYQLLSELDKTFVGKVEQTQLDFVETTVDGKAGHINFTITSEEVNDLKNLIKVVMQEIRNLEFLN